MGQPLSLNVINILDGAGLFVNSEVRKEERKIKEYSGHVEIDAATPRSDIHLLNIWSIQRFAV